MEKSSPSKVDVAFNKPEATAGPSCTDTVVNGTDSTTGMVAVADVVSATVVDDLTIHYNNEALATLTTTTTPTTVTKTMGVVVSQDKPSRTTIRNKNKKKRQRQKQNKWQKQNQSNPKRRKMERYWIEDCCDTVLPKTNGYIPSLELLITRSTLNDNYVPAPAEADSTNQSLSKSSESTHDEETESPQVVDNQNLAENLREKASSSSDPSLDGANPSQTVDTECPKPHCSEASPEDGNTCEEIAFVCVKRANSAKKPMRVDMPSMEHFRPLPNGDCGDGIVNPYPKDQVGDKFWSQRRRLFSLFDRGIQLDKESWFSVTPEVIANHIAAHLVGNRSNVIVLDPFCGCGGNSIAFAKRPEVDLVICVDTDLSKLKMASSNASVYGVASEKMVFIHGNGCQVLSCYQSGKLKHWSDDSSINQDATT